MKNFRVDHHTDPNLGEWLSLSPDFPCRGTYDAHRKHSHVSFVTVLSISDAQQIRDDLTKALIEVDARKRERVASDSQPEQTP